MLKPVLTLLLLTVVSSNLAAEVRVAVATNFRPILEQLHPAFEAKYSTPTITSSGSTGALYHQIVSGAPYDVFLAADRASVDMLLDTLSAAGESFCYARGKLVLVGGNGSLNQLASPALNLAIANPATAPYGSAAAEVLQRSEFATGAGRQLVRGSNAMQAYQYWHTGNVALALVPYSLSGDAGTLIPQDWHSPIEQHALLLRDSPEARAYMHWLKSADVRAKIVASGYDACP